MRPRMCYGAAVPLIAYELVLIANENSEQVQKMKMRG
jgi:hypothetical protein